MAKKRRTAKPESQPAEALPLRRGRGSDKGISAGFMPDSAGRYPLSAYALMNALFGGFCVLNLMIIRQTMRETRGLYFFFGLLIAGFLAVSLYDYVFDRMNPQTGHDQADESGVSGA